jgi:hypothetical protein
VVKILPPQPAGRKAKPEDVLPDEAIRAVFWQRERNFQPESRRCKGLRLQRYANYEAALQSEAHDSIGVGRHPEIRNDRERSANKAIF